MKRLMMSTAMVAAFALPSLAQDGAFLGAPTAGAVRASDLIGARIYASEQAVDGTEYNGVQDGWDDIGEINDIILTREGAVDAVLVDIGGFLGMGERQAAVSMGSLRFVADSATADNADDWFLVLNANRATLETAPEWQMSDSTMGGATNGTVMQDQTATDTTGTGTATTGTATTGTAMTGTGTDGTTMATDGASSTTTDGMVTADGTTASDMVREGYSAVGTTELTSEMLTGATAYDANDQNVGEIADLILAEDGKISAAVIDVGGFLGMGAKPVEVKLEELDILRQDDGSDVRVYISLTKEQMEEMPSYSN